MGDHEFAFYGMHRNYNWGSCLAVVCSVDNVTQESDGLTTSLFVIFVVTDTDLTSVTSAVELEQLMVFPEGSIPLLRIASECMFGMFGDSHCDCESQRVAAMQLIRDHRYGVYAHLPQEGQGHGLFYKAQELNLQVRGLTPDGNYLGPQSMAAAAEHLLGMGAVDRRSYSSLRTALSNLGLSRYTYRLITSNVQKTAAIASELGISILDTISTEHQVDADNAGEFLTKLYRRKCALTPAELLSIEAALVSAKKIPGRTLMVLSSIRDELERGTNFGVDLAVLQRIVSLVDRESSRREPAIALLSEPHAETYDEFHLELQISPGEFATIADASLTGIERVQYEVNEFYDTLALTDVAGPDLKIRTCYDVSHTPARETERRLFFKLPRGKDVYSLRTASLSEEVHNLLRGSLLPYQKRAVGVIAHVCRAKDPRLLILLKRYADGLRTLSVMGPPDIAREFVSDVTHRYRLRQVHSPTDYRNLVEYSAQEVEQVLRYLDEELAIFRRHRRTL